MVRLMLVSLIVMMVTIVALYFTPLTVAPLIAASLYAGLWAYERRLGVASPITRIMIVFYLLFAFAATGLMICPGWPGSPRWFIGPWRH